MTLIGFSFKREALWMMLPTLAALLVAGLVYLLKRLAF
jgi:hypothetical protein